MAEKLEMKHLQSFYEDVAARRAEPTAELLFLVQACIGLLQRIEALEAGFVKVK